MYTTCQLSLNLETGAQKVPLKHVALVFPEYNMNKKVMLWGPASPALLQVTDRAGPCFHLMVFHPPPPHISSHLNFPKERSWHGTRSAINVHADSSRPVHEFTTMS